MSNKLQVIKENLKTKFNEIKDQKLDDIAKFIMNNGQYQKMGKYVVFKLFNSVSEREEVFIGNVLFNDYISKLLVRTYRAKDNYDGQIELVYNDLENFYYVVEQDDFSLEELENDFKEYFAENLEELFFEDENLEKGIYGEFDNKLLKFYSTYKSVFPFYSIPNIFSDRLINLISEQVKAKLDDDNIYPTELTANLVNFFCKDGNEKQSPAKFLIKRCKEGIISKNKLAEALHIKINNLEESKDDIKKAIKELRNYDFEKQISYRNLILEIINYYEEREVDLYIQDLMTKLPPEKYVKEIIDDLFLDLKTRTLKVRQTCSVCGTIISKNKYNKNDKVNKEVQFGKNASSFINRISTITPKPDNRNKGKTVCMNCLLYSFLKCKFLGTISSEEADNQIPEKRNLVFFFGHISKDRINQIQGILNSLHYCTRNPSVYTYEWINNTIAELERNNLGKQNASADDILQELIKSDKKEKPTKVPATIWDWYKNGQQGDKIKTHVFSVGQGQRKLYTFVLPYALNRSDELQKKFSQNKVAVYSMLSFLSRLVGTQGNFYYLSTPRITDEYGEKNIFYYKDNPKKGMLKRYELLTEVAWELIDDRKITSGKNKSKYVKSFERRLKLANDLEQLPLITLSKIYREIVDDELDSNYKNLSKIKNLGITNLLPLIKTSYELRDYKSKKEGIKFMGQQIDTEQLKQFTDDLFSELVLISGIFPKSFSKSPTEFEKYPRLLIKKILKYDNEEGKDVLAGYREWSTKVLHSAKEFYGENKNKEKIAERLERIKQSIVKHQQILSQKSNLLYLKRSLFGWITEFLYPLYSLTKVINSEIENYQENEIEKVKKSSELERIKQNFKKMNYDFEKSFELAKNLLTENANYYKEIKEN